MENVPWEDVVELCRKLSELPAEKRAGRKYRLPTEAPASPTSTSHTFTRLSPPAEATRLPSGALQNGQGSARSPARQCASAGRLSSWLVTP
jgi:hypothetical protein